MMRQKQILRPDRLRQVPAQFSWIDQRLVRDNFLRHAAPAAWALYLVLALPLATGAPAPTGTRLGQPLSVGDILRRALEGGAA